MGVGATRYRLSELPILPVGASGRCHRGHRLSPTFNRSMQVVLSRSPRPTARNQTALHAISSMTVYSRPSGGEVLAYYRGTTFRTGQEVPNKRSEHLAGLCIMSVGPGAADRRLVGRVPRISGGEARDQVILLQPCAGYLKMQPAQIAGGALRTVRSGPTSARESIEFRAVVDERGTGLT